jgi:prophage antirepressor-like protein
MNDFIKSMWVMVLPSYEHFHLGYFEHGNAIEAFGFKNEQGTYDVYVDDTKDRGLFDIVLKRHEVYGVLLFTEKSDYKASSKFRMWVENELLPFRKNKQ